MFIDTNGLVFNDGAQVLDMQGQGAVGGRLQAVHFDPGLLRPYVETNPGSPFYNRACADVIVGNQWDDKQGQLVPKKRKFLVQELQQRGVQLPVFNATLLPKDAWIQLDSMITRAARQRLRAWADLRASSTYGGFNAMARMTLEFQSMSDPGEAIVDMDGITPGRTDRPLFDIKSIPLPITHSDFWFSAREIAISRNTGAPLDTTMAEAAGRRVAEMIERTTIGTETGATYGTRSTGQFAHTGTSTVYGYTNTPYRITKTDLNAPVGTNPEAVNMDVMEMLELAYAQGFFGPFILYHSTGYSRFLNDDYFRSGSTSAVRSLRTRILENEGITDIRRLDYLTTGYQLILVQMDPETARAIDGMGITTVQWESQGGMRINFKVMAIQVPQIRSKYNGTTGIVHATTA